MTSLLAVLLLSAVGMRHDVPVHVNGAPFALDALDAMTEGTLMRGRWSGVGVANPGDAPADVTLSLQRDGEVIEHVQMKLAAGGTRVIRIDRLFAAFAEGGEIAFQSSAPVLLFAYADDEPGLTTHRRRRAVRHPSNPPVLVPRTVTLTPAKDNTLYDIADGSLSNGAGIHLFAG